MGKLEVMKLPRLIFFGPKAVNKIPTVIKQLLSSDKNLLIISGGKKTTSIAKMHVLPFLINERIDANIVSIGREINIPLLVNISNKIKDKDIALLGVGGGKVLDATKLISLIANKEYISVPTSPGNDGIASPSLSYLIKVDYEKFFKKRLSIAKSPLAVIADTDIIKRAPYITFLSGFGDLVSKLVAVKDWKLAHKLKGEEYSEYAASLALMSAKLVISKYNLLKIRNEESARLLVKALIGSGAAMSIAGSSRPASGSEHLFSHALDLLSRKYHFKPAPHGLQCAVGTIIMLWLYGGKWKIIRKVLQKIRAPVTAKELKIDKKYIIEALTIAHKIRPERYTILGESGLTKEAAIKAAKETGVIE